MSELLRLGSRVKTLPLQERDGLMVVEYQEDEQDYSTRRCVSANLFDQDGSSSRTYRHCDAGAWEQSSKGLPRFGMMQNGRVSQHPQSALLSGANAFGLSHEQFRSPNARDWKGMSARSWRERSKGDKTPTLPDQVGGTPHPEFVERLMGFPSEWTG